MEVVGKTVAEWKKQYSTSIFNMSYIIKINTGTLIRFTTAVIISLEAAF